ncbi:hypothetical protein KR222_001273 [Zaprionus bogoriensis]|nr:hypothetical protein KR222_001273 [Zaprionus bogoriensis]
MARQRFLVWYHNYALAIGVTSHRLVERRLRQTWKTWSYALFVNAFELIVLPVLMWFSTTYLAEQSFFPKFASFTTYIFYSVAYVAIACTILSRGSRDSASVELDRTAHSLMRKTTKRADRALVWLFYLKLATMVYMCLFSLGSGLLMPDGTPWIVIAMNFCFFNALNIPTVATYRYFMSLWFISGCYQYINSRLRDISNSARSREPLRSELREVHRLWSLHALLARCTLRINKVYGPLLLVARFDFVTFSVVNAYWGMLFMKTITTPFYKIMYGAANYWVRMLDFFLLDTMCNLTAEYQSAAHHEVSEAIWSKEVLQLHDPFEQLLTSLSLQIETFLFYASLAKIKLWVCGLYTMDRRCWLGMMGWILNLAILLLQFHLIHVKN